MKPSVTKNKIGTIDNQAVVVDLTNRWKHALADYQNLERRYSQEKADFVQYANTNLLIRLITVLDHLERAGSHLQDPGLDLAIKEFNRVLEEEGLVEISATGQVFDPNQMEAVATDPGVGTNQVAEVLAKGYSLKGKVIRPAKVKVGIKK